MRDLALRNPGILRVVLVAAVALVVGLVIGGLGPRAQVRALQAEIRELEARPRRGSGDVTSLFRGRTWEDPDRAPTPADPEPASPDDPVDPPEPRDLDPEPAGRPGSAPPPPVVDEESAERIKDALEIRRAQAMAALRERAEASDEQMDDVDRIVDRMNEELAVVAETWVAAAGEGDLSRREMMLLASDTLDVLIETEDSLFETFDDDQRAALSDDVLDPTAFVDGSVVDRFSELDP